MYHQSRLISGIDAEIQRLEEKKLRLLSLPEDKYEHGDVVWFTKQFGGGGTVYTYAAIKIGNRWYLTQKGGYTVGQEPMLWDALLEFVGDNEMWAATEWEVVQ